MLQELLVRLACIRHAASVYPEPGSNSPQKQYLSIFKVCVSAKIDGCDSYHYSVVKVLFIERAGFYHQPPSLSRLVRDKKPDVFQHRLVRLPGACTGVSDAERPLFSCNRFASIGENAVC